jgi:poly(hydroxyalkanoate) depolymerase family esterase
MPSALHRLLGDALRSLKSAIGARRDETPGASRTDDDDGAFIHQRYTDGMGTRRYQLYVPPARHSGTLPLVVMLHGCTQTPDDFAAGTAMNEAAQRHGFYVLYPAQSRRANLARCWNWFKHNHQQRGSGEPALLAGMTREVMQRHPVDPRRVFVAGLSAGGAMAAILGDAYPELYAAVGVHSGLPTGAASDATGAMAVMKNGVLPSAPSPLRPRAAAPVPPAQRPGGPPTIVFHGDQDATVHPDNGEHVLVASLGASRQAARSAFATVPGGLPFTIHRHVDARGQVKAEHWVVHGGGHGWSGGRPGASYTEPNGPDATDEMLRFFFNHPRP